jgi:hypothetical protein
MFITHNAADDVTSLNVKGVRIDNPNANTNVRIHTMMNGMMNNANVLTGIDVVFKSLNFIIVVLIVSNLIQVIALSSCYVEK